MAPNEINFSVPYDKAHQLSLTIIKTIEEEEMGASVVALSLTLGRLLNPEPLSPDEEREFVTNLIDWAGSYVATKEGLAN